MKQSVRWLIFGISGVILLLASLPGAVLARQSGGQQQAQPLITLYVKVGAGYTGANL